MNRRGNRKKEVIEKFRKKGKRSIPEICAQYDISRNWVWELLNKHYQNLFYKIKVDNIHFYIAKFNVPSDNNTFHLFLRGVNDGITEGRRKVYVVRGKEFASNIADIRGLPPNRLEWN